MPKFSYCHNLMNLMMKRRYACCFHYDFDSRNFDYNGNFPKEDIFSCEGLDPIDSLLKSHKVFTPDKPTIAKFYKALKAENAAESNPYLECIVRITSESGTVALSVSVGSEISDGKVSGLIGYMVSLANFSEEAVCVPKSEPFEVDRVVQNINNAGENFAIVQFDICRFKLINQKYGDAVGDTVLENIRANLESAWGRNAVTCRLGADIFSIFTEYGDIEELESRIDSVRDTLQSYHNITYRFSFGVYIVKDKSIPLRTMSDNAAIARRKAKESAVEAVHYFEDSLSDDLKNRHLIESEMQQALDGGQFKVYLQPKCRTQDGKIIGAEALARWVHPERGIIPPDKFIPIFEENGFIEHLDRHIHTSVCKILRKWLDNGIECVPISVNVSRACLNNLHIADGIREIVDKYRIPLSLFQIEITETCDSHEFERAIKRIKQAGFTLLMDDFGSGYSSLNTLKNTPFDVIKLDREFLDNSLQSERGRKILTHTIAMTHDIGLEMVAEGVETGEQASFLNRNGCKYAQGFFYLRPVPTDQFELRTFGRIIHNS